MSYTSPSKEEIEKRRSDLAPFDSVNERCALIMISCILSAYEIMPKYYLDLGSGTGSMVNIARKLGIEAYGVDVINGPERWFINHDLSVPLYFSVIEDGMFMSVNRDGWEYRDDPNPAFDLITCLEVAEHIPIDNHLVLAETISRHMKEGSILVFSSAPPGQSGEHHVGCRHPWKWRDIFYDHGINYNRDLTMKLSHLWSWTAGPLMWLGSNVQVFNV